MNGEEPSSDKGRSQPDVTNLMENTRLQKNREGQNDNEDAQTVHIPWSPIAGYLEISINGKLLRDYFKMAIEDPLERSRLHWEMNHIAEEVLRNNKFSRAECLPLIRR